MTITVRLVTIHHLIQIKKTEKIFFFFFLWWELLGAALLTTFLSIIQQFYLLSSCCNFQYLFCNQKFVPVNTFVSGFFRHKMYIWLYIYLASSSSIMLKFIYVIAWISSSFLKNLYWGVLWMYCIFCFCVLNHSFVYRVYSSVSFYRM